MFVFIFLIASAATFNLLASLASDEYVAIVEFDILLALGAVFFSSCNSLISFSKAATSAAFPTNFLFFSKSFFSFICFAMPSFVFDES